MGIIEGKNKWVLINKDWVDKVYNNKLRVDQSVDDGLINMWWDTNAWLVKSNHYLRYLIHSLYLIVWYVLYKLCIDVKTKYVDCDSKCLKEKSLT